MSDKPEKTNEQEIAKNTEERWTIYRSLDSWPSNGFKNYLLALISTPFQYILVAKLNSTLNIEIFIEIIIPQDKKNPNY